MSSTARLKSLLHALTPSESIGELKLGDVTFPVPTANDPTRLPSLPLEELLDWKDRNSSNNVDLEWLLKKYILGQDVFIVGEPGGLYARRLVMTFCR
jgi:hypothetical protein